MDNAVDDVDFSLPSSRLGCARCDLELTTVRRYLDGLSYENVNDVEVRASLRASLGFCTHHAWQYFDVTHDSLGVAIIYRDILGMVLAELRILARDSPVSHLLRRFTPSPGSRDHAVHQAVRMLRPRAPCPACQALALAVAERGHRTAYLCLPHLRAAALSGSLGGTSLSAAWAQSMRRLRRLASDEAVRGRHEQRGWNATSPRGSVLDLAETAFGKPGIVNIRPGPAREIAEDVGPELLSGDTLALVSEGEGCLVCAWLRHEVTRLLDASEQSFPEYIARLIEAGDLCTGHAWLALEMNGGVAEARRHPLLLSHLGLLERHASSPASFRNCRVCSVVARRGQAYCTALRGLVDEEILCPIPAAQGFLCLPHFLHTIEGARADTAVELARRAVSALQQLHTDLSEYIRKEDYRFQGEPKGKEQFAPVRALATIAGPRWLD